MTKDDCLKQCVEWLFNTSCPHFVADYGGYWKDALRVWLWSKGYDIDDNGNYTDHLGAIVIYWTRNKTSTHAVAVKKGKKFNPNEVKVSSIKETIMLALHHG